MIKVPPYLGPVAGSVGVVGEAVGLAVGEAVGEAVGLAVGLAVGEAVGVSSAAGSPHPISRALKIIMQTIPNNNFFNPYLLLNCLIGFHGLYVIHKP
jgi:hypothetical protein